MKARATAVLAITAIVVVGAGFCGFAWWRSQQKAALLASALPPAPELSGQPEAFRQRHAACVARVQNGADATAALGELSRLYHANGFQAEAVFCYSVLEQLESDQAIWWHRHAAVLAGFGDIAAALPLEKRAVELAPNYTPARLRLADLHLKNNAVDRAAETYREVLRRKPDETYAELGLARCDFEAGRWEPARVRLEQLVAATNHRLGYDLIVTVYERLGQTARAAALRGREQASGAYRDPPDPWIDGLIDDCYEPFQLSLVAGFAASSGDPARSIRLLERAIAVSPNNFALHFQLGGVHLSQRAYTKAREQFQLCTTLAPEFPDGWFFLSDVLATIGDRAGSERTLAEGLERCPNSPGLHAEAARRHQRARRVEEAITEYRTSIRLRPNEAPTSVELARLLIQQGRVPEARTVLEQALLAEPEHPGALTILAYDAISEGNEAAARQWLRRVLNQPRTVAEQRTSLLDAFRHKFGRRFE